MEAGKLTIKMAPFKTTDLLDNLHAVTGQNRHRQRLAADQRNRQQSSRCSSGDVERLHQITVNLVNNALKFTDKGSIHVKLFQPYENKWGIEVSDTGAGIPRIRTAVCLRHLPPGGRNSHACTWRVWFRVIHCQTACHPDERRDQGAQHHGGRDYVHCHPAVW